MPDDLNTLLRSLSAPGVPQRLNHRRPPRQQRPPNHQPSLEPSVRLSRACSLRAAHVLRLALSAGSFRYAKRRRDHLGGRNSPPGKRQAGSLSSS